MPERVYWLAKIVGLLVKGWTWLKAHLAEPRQ